MQNQKNYVERIVVNKLKRGRLSLRLKRNSCFASKRLLGDFEEQQLFYKLGTL